MKIHEFLNWACARLETYDWSASECRRRDGDGVALRMVLDLAKCDLTYYRWHSMVGYLCYAADLSAFKPEDLLEWSKTATLDDIKKICAEARDETVGHS
jgi:hypothetical protein